MAIERLDHYTIRTSKLDATRRFYVDVVGLREGPRPPFAFPGAWLYCGDIPVVHLIGAEASASGTGTIDHVAFRATDLRQLHDRLRDSALGFEERTVPMLDVHQVFIEDPNGLTIELNFDPAEVSAAA